MLFLDGVYTGGADGRPMRFLKVKAPAKVDLTRLAHTIAQRVGRFLERQGLLERDTWRNGTTHVIFEPLDFTASAHPCARGISASMHVISRLVALIPKPRVNLTRFHGIFAPYADIGIMHRTASIGRW